MDFRAQPERYLVTGLPVLATALLLSATTHAASNAVLPCAQVERDLQSLEVPVDALSAESVDHAQIDTEIIDDQTAVTESATPILNLGPRVTSILREVFELTSDELTQEASQAPATSPLADSDLEEDVVRDDTANEKNELPRFQRRMLRNDI